MQQEDFIISPILAQNEDEENGDIDIDSNEPEETPGSDGSDDNSEGGGGDNSGGDDENKS